MEIKLKLAGAIMLFALAGCATQPAATPVYNQERVQSTQQTQAVTSEPQTIQAEPAAEAKTKTYVNEVYGFSLEYPASWEVIDRDGKGMGIIITANDEDNEWHGTGLNMNFKYTDGDYGMGTKTIKTSEITNPNGIKFSLDFSAQDEEFNKEFDVKPDPGFRSITIGTDFIPGLIVFNYHTDVNPKGEEQLMEMLNSIRKL
jgi:hypothetical protein